MTQRDKKLGTLGDVSGRRWRKAGALALIVLARIFGPTVWVSTTGHLMALSAVAMATMVTAYWLDRPLRDAFTALLDRLVLSRTAPCRASA